MSYEENDEGISADVFLRNILEEEERSQISTSVFSAADEENRPIIS